MIDISKDTLLGIEEICQKLSISRSTLERMRGNAGPRALGALGIQGRTIIAKPIAGDESLCKTPFPPPSCMIGRSPRWTTAVINEWLKNEAFPR